MGIRFLRNYIIVHLLSICKAKTDLITIHRLCILFFLIILVNRLLNHRIQFRSTFSILHVRFSIVHQCFIIRCHTSLLRFQFDIGALLLKSHIVWQKIWSTLRLFHWSEYADVFWFLKSWEKTALLLSCCRDIRNIKFILTVSQVHMRVPELIIVSYRLNIIT